MYGASLRAYAVGVEEEDIAFLSSSAAENLEPLYDDTYEKVQQIEAYESNRFNIL
jgi:hypothetical protein